MHKIWGPSYCLSDEAVWIWNPIIHPWFDRSLFFVAISSTGEPEAVLRQQLEFIHNQILFVLTAKVTVIVSSHPISIGS